MVESRRIIFIILLLITIIICEIPEYGCNSSEDSGAISSRDADNAKEKTKVRSRRSTISNYEEVSGLSFHDNEEKKRIYLGKDGVWNALEGISDVVIVLYGKFDINKKWLMRLTNIHSCDDGDVKFPSKSLTLHSSGIMAYATIEIPGYTDPDNSKYQVCIAPFDDNNRNLIWHLQESDKKPWLLIQVYGGHLPVWLNILSIFILLALSGLFSGLNLGLMSLNKTDLKIIVNTGTVQEKKFATSITPVRNHGNFLLCVLLFSNVLVNCLLTILMDDLMTGILAVVLSTLGIVVVGEIIPQAVCSRFGLAVGAKTIGITKFFMFMTFPLAYPLSKILDATLGEEIGSVYTRDRLKELLKVTKDYHGLGNEEVGIISGTLELQQKTVKDIMTKLDDVYMISLDSVMDFDTMAEITEHGFSRIPVFEKERSNTVALLNVKQLTLLDPSENIPLHTVIDYYHIPLFFVFENTRLDYMFRAFREGNRGHLAFVQKVNEDGPREPYCETIGIVTMEDVLEELLQAEIMDESDIGKLEARLRNANPPRYIGAHGHHNPKAPVFIPQTLTLATVQFLNTSVEPFKSEFISVPILDRIVRSTVCLIKVPQYSVHSSNKPAEYLYELGKPTENFILILEGRVKVEVGVDRLTYEGGPFTAFGVQFLMEDKPENNDPKQYIADFGSKPCKTFIPDYSVKVLTDIHYMKLKYATYRAARFATDLEKIYQDPKKAAANSTWEEDIERVLEQALESTALT